MLTWAQIGKSIVTQFLVGKDYLKWEAYQFLISRAYAVPLYPWGLDAIELGLAIDIKKHNQQLSRNNAKPITEEFTAKKLP